MKIAHIAPPWIAVPPQNYGGTEVVIYNLVEEQVAQGHDVTLLAAGDAKTSAKLVSFFPQSLRAAGVPWQAHPKAFYHLYKAVEYVKDHDFDILHTHLSSGGDMYLFPLLSHLSTAHIMTLHSCFPFDRVETWTGDADQYYMEWASSVPMVAISKSARDEVTYPLDFVGVVHHGLPMTKFNPTVDKPEDFFAWLGRIVPDKGTHRAIDAAKQAGVPLVLAGIVDRSVQESVNYFEDVVKPRIDGRQIRYIGPVDHDQKVDLLSRATGFLNPIEWQEPFGMVMIEAMAVGCPVITFPRGAAPEIVKHGKTGFLARNVDEMVSFIPRTGEIDRAATRAYVKQNFSVQAMAKKYVKIYKKVIATTQFVARQTAPPKLARSRLVIPASVVKVEKPLLPQKGQEGKKRGRLTLQKRSVVPPIPAESDT